MITAYIIGLVVLAYASRGLVARGFDLLTWHAICRK